VRPLIWQPGGDWQELRDHAVQVWLADYREWDGEAGRCAALLSADELERASRFRAEGRRREYEITRGLLRLLLARYTGKGAAGICLSYGAQGKPALAANEGPHFNVSHSGAYALYGFSRAGPLGVDIERLRAAMPRRDEIARKHFAPGEITELEHLPEAERDAAFFRCWTRKEAFVKARGDGIFAGLHSFEVSLAPGDARLVQLAGEQDASKEWCLAEMPEVPGYAGAAAVRAPTCDWS